MPQRAELRQRQPFIGERALDARLDGAGRDTRLSTDPKRGMAGRTVQSLIDVLEASGSLAEIACVVNKEAFL